MRILFQLSVQTQAYSLYASGLPRASRCLAQLEKDPRFLRFLWRDDGRGSPMSLCEFINRPLRHLADLCRVLGDIRDTLEPCSRLRTTYTEIVDGLQSVLDTTVSVETVTSSFISLSTSAHDVSASCADVSVSRRMVPRMGARSLKRVSSSSSSSGFGSGGSQHSQEDLRDVVSDDSARVTIV